MKTIAFKRELNAIKECVRSNSNSPRKREMSHPTYYIQLCIENLIYESDNNNNNIEWRCRPGFLNAPWKEKFITSSASIYFLLIYSYKLLFYIFVLQEANILIKTQDLHLIYIFCFHSLKAQIYSLWNIGPFYGWNDFAICARTNCQFLMGLSKQHRNYHNKIGSNRRVEVDLIHQSRPPV